MNILTYDTEEWYLEKILHGGRKEKYAEFDYYLHQIVLHPFLSEQRTSGFLRYWLIVE